MASATEPLWPGITRGCNALCQGCSWALLRGVYQVKARSTGCPEHGGPLEQALDRIARQQARDEGGRP
jgi:hypothetical protein